MTAASPIDVPRSEHPRAPGEARSEHRGPLGEAGGAVPDGTTVFDNEVPGVTNLDPALLAALRRAATDAAGDGVDFFVDSGWRSAGYQERLLREAVSKYGSEAEAARWVATPGTSAHVSGDAVNIGPSDAAAWLSEHGAAYGLCQIYGNEPWHYELRPEAIDHGCPPMYSDATHDPRMQRRSTVGSRPWFRLRNLKEDLEDFGSNFDGAPDLEFRMATKALELEQSGLSYQRIPPGYRFPYGHTHKQQEELYVVVRGSGRMKLDDEIVEVEEWDVVRVPPGTWRGYEAGPEGLEILVFGAPNLGEDPREDVEGQRDWWAD